MCIIFACWSNTFIHFVLTPAISQMVISSRFDAHLKRKVSLWNILSLNGNLSRAVWKEILCDAFSKLNKHPLIIGFLMLFSSVNTFHRCIRLLGISWWRLIGFCLAFASLFFYYLQIRCCLPLDTILTDKVHSRHLMFMNYYLAFIYYHEFKVTLSH